MKKEVYEQYGAILGEELLAAAGEPEPVALAYCAATLRDVLGTMPERIVAEISGSMVKNRMVMAAFKTGILKGIETAIAIGIVAGKSDIGLQEAAEVSEENLAKARDYGAKTEISVSYMDSPCALDIILHGYSGMDRATVRIANHYTNIVHKEKNGEIFLNLPVEIPMEGQWN